MIIKGNAIEAVQQGNVDKAVSDREPSRTSWIAACRCEAWTAALPTGPAGLDAQDHNLKK